MRQATTALLVLSALGLCCAGAGGCAGSGDLTRREKTLRQRQYQLNKREAHLRAAEKTFSQCVVERYPGETSGLDAPPPTAGPAAPAGSAAAGGALTVEAVEEIQRVERLGEPAVIACYTAELERRGNKSLKGRVVVRILVGTRGAADDVQIGESTLKVQRVHSCIKKTIRQWELPKIEAPSWYSRTYDFSPAY